MESSKLDLSVLIPLYNERSLRELHRWITDVITTNGGNVRGAICR